MAGDDYEFISQEDRERLALKERQLLEETMSVEGDCQVHPSADEKFSFSKISMKNVTLKMNDSNIISNINLDLESNKRYGIYGRNGTGKTLLVKAFDFRKMPIPENVSIELVEEMAPDQIPISDCLPKLTKEKTELIEEFEEYLGYLNRRAKEKTQMRDARNEKLGFDKNFDCYYRSELLYDFGFDMETLEKMVCDLSGGWRMKIALCKALLKHPDILLLDDPGSMLDYKTKEALKKKLRTYPNCVLFISHDKSFFNVVATDILHTQDGKICHFDGKWMDFSKKLAKETKKKDAWSIPVGEKIKCTMVETNTMGFYYKISRELFRDTSIIINQNTRAIIQGDNGAGKTTLIRLFLKEISPITGTVYCHDKTTVGYYNQFTVDDLDGELNCIENVTLQLKETIPSLKEAAVITALSKFGFSLEQQKVPVKFLSAGTKSRAIFAKLYIQKPNLLFLDEPTNHLDIEGSDALIECIKKFRGAVLVVTHDTALNGPHFKEIWTVRDRCVFMEQNVFE